ncbi:MAG: hypothetical protein DRN04_10460 [Thermoprotei archaeon]|nr:MAG: hypothetical protein DRN04_10460 [Thermoprotei archaeon]
MIIDTTYLLPLARISINTDLLKAIAEKRLKVKISFSDLKVSLISLFELQAKASKLNIPPEYVSKAIDVILRNFTVVPFYQNKIISKAHELRRIIDDYIDCIIVATAVVLKEDLATEDRTILSVKNFIKKKYNIKVVKYKDIALPKS